MEQLANKLNKRTFLYLKLLKKKTDKLSKWTFYETIFKKF